MKALLLFACLLLSAVLYAQDTTIVKRNNETITIIRTPNPTNDTVKSKPRLFDIGGGLQINMLENMGFFYGPLASIRANHKNGRLAGILNISYNLGEPYKAIDRDYYFYHNGQPDSLNFLSEAKYNFLKIGMAIQVPFYNRTNKKSLSISGILGASYYNGLGSGYFISYQDKDTRKKQYFSANSHNLEYYSIEIGLNLSYTISRYQIFADFSFVKLSSFDTYKTLNVYDKTVMSADIISYGHRLPGSPNKTTAFNIGLRYCLYTPWQTKPTKRG